MKLSTLNKFILIAHHPRKGQFLISPIHLNYGIIGAALLEMSFNKQIKIEDNKLILLNNKSSDNSISSEILDTIRLSRETRKIRYWIIKLTKKPRKFKWKTLANLEEKKLLKIENRKFLGLIPYKRSYLTESNSRDKLINQLKSDILSGRDLDNDTVILLSLVEACKMHKIITSNKDEIKILKIKLNKIIKDNSIADTVDETIKQVQAAIITAIIIPTIST